jgi:hypothetical protein
VVYRHANNASLNAAHNILAMGRALWGERLLLLEQKAAAPARTGAM